MICKADGCQNEARVLPMPDGGETHTKYCQACTDEIRAKERREAFEVRLWQSGIPQQYWTYDKALGNPELLQWCIDHSGGWMFLGGAAGEGKTRALARAAVIECWKQEHFPHMLWMSSADVFGMIASRDRAERAAGLDVIRTARQVSILTINDLGMETINGEGRGILFSLIDQRYRESKRTWIDTNASGEELAASISEGRWEQIKRRILERGHLRLWDGTGWVDKTAMVTTTAERYWWQDI